MSLRWFDEVIRRVSLLRSGLNRGITQVYLSKTKLRSYRSKSTSIYRREGKMSHRMLSKLMMKL